MSGVVVIGASSLIAQALQARPEAAGWRFLGHAQALSSPAWLDGVRVVVNCAFDPRLKNGPYATAHDVDLRLAAALREIPGIRYVMLSSRLAYGPAGAGGRLHEALLAAPDRPYGIAKLTTEKALASLLGDRLTVLRLANVFGDEAVPGRQNFFAIALRSLRDKGRIVLDMSPFVTRDFIPVEELALAVAQVVRAPQPGLFNIGSGAGTPTGRIAQWLIEGFGDGEMVVSDMREFDQFWLDISAAQQAFGIAPVSSATLRARCMALGHRLRPTHPDPAQFAMQL